MKCNRNRMLLKTCVWVVLACGAVLGQERPPQPSFLQYYSPVDVAFEPNAPGYGLPLDMGSITNWQAVASRCTST